MQFSTFFRRYATLFFHACALYLLFSLCYAFNFHNVRYEPLSFSMRASIRANSWHVTTLVDAGHYGVIGD
eukprot:c27033_g3_i1 orf=2-208(-)